MGRTLILLLSCLSITLSVHSYYYDLPSAVSKGEKLTKLHFFLHENRGENPTVVTIARAPNVTGVDPTSPVPYASIRCFDDYLTVSIDANSEVIGSAQGLGVSASRDTTTAVLYLDYGFTKGKYNGSSLSMFSRNQVLQNPRELAVVGGKGRFKMARGFANITTVFSNSTYFVVEYYVTVLHFDGNNLGGDDELISSYNPTDDE